MKHRFLSLLCAASIALTGMKRMELDKSAAYIAFAAGPAAGASFPANYSVNELKNAPVKPTVSLSRETISLEEAKKNPVRTVQMKVSGANRKYATTGLNVRVRSGARIVQTSSGKPDCQAGAAIANLEYHRMDINPKIADSAQNIPVGAYFGTVGDADTGTDGILWEFKVRLPDNVKEGDTFPIEIVCLNDDDYPEFFTNVSYDSAGVMMQDWVFTAGIEQGYIKINSESTSSTLGDIDFNNKVTADDAQIALMAYLNHLSSGSWGITVQQYRRANVNGDGTLNADDAQYILIFAVKTLANQNPKWSDLIQS